MSITITPRQADILRELCLGKTRLEIASALQISERAVNSYLMALYERLEVSNAVQAIHLANNAEIYIFNKNNRRKSTPVKFDIFDAVIGGYGIDLSDTEHEIVYLIKSGLTPKECAKIRQCSVRTIDSHIRNIQKKLSVKGIKQIASYRFKKQMRFLTPIKKRGYIKLN